MRVFSGLQLTSVGMWTLYRQNKPPVWWVSFRPAATQGLIRPVTQASQGFSCSLPQQPDNSSPALRAASECPSDPCGTPAPLAADTSSSLPAPSGSSAWN